MNNLAVVKDQGALNDLGVVKSLGLLKVLFVSLIHFDHWQVYMMVLSPGMR